MVAADGGSGWNGWWQRMIVADGADGGSGWWQRMVVADGTDRGADGVADVMDGRDLMLLFVF